MPPAPARIRASAFALAGALAVVAAPARATLLDEPPKLFTFKLDDPAASRLTLLANFHEAEVARPALGGRYMAGPWGRWGHEPWWTLAWQRNASSDAEATGAGSPGADPAAGDAAADLDEPVSLAALTRLLARGAASPAGAEGRDPLASTGALRFAPEQAPTWLGQLEPDVPSFLASTGASFASNGFDALWAPTTKPKPDWRCRRRPIRFVRYGAESDAFPLLRCDGAVALQALDRLSLMARPPDVSRPGELLPDEPDAGAWARGEWAPGVRVVNPRVLWLLQRISDAFPWRTVYIFSGYRPATGSVKPGSHHSLHGEARAMDISVMGVPNAALFKFCHTLDDVGCGFYPNSKFVHVDVRGTGSGHPFWIDISGPGEPSQYVDAWPGVVEAGALAWDARRQGESSVPGGEANCTRRSR